jgi:hypothetical protein
VIWWERCTKIRLLRLGPTDDKAFKTFSVLRECYLQLGRYNDALKSGQEWLEAAKKASGLNHIYVSQLQSLLETMLVEKCHAKIPVSLGTLPAKLPPLYLSFTPTYLLRKSSVNPYILKLFK